MIKSSCTLNFHEHRRAVSPHLCACHTCVRLTHVRSPPGHRRATSHIIFVGGTSDTWTTSPQVEKRTELVCGRCCCSPCTESIMRSYFSTLLLISARFSGAFAQRTTEDVQVDLQPCLLAQQEPVRSLRIESCGMSFVSVALHPLQVMHDESTKRELLWYICSASNTAVLLSGAKRYDNLIYAACPSYVEHIEFWCSFLSWIWKPDNVGKIPFTMSMT